jgi:GNAT superfamily N-acetyltransferase
MSVYIRTVKLEDAPVITRLSHQLGYAISEADTITNLQWLEESPNDIVYVAVADNKVVGWMHIFYTVRVESSPFCEIAGLVVDEQQREKGIGKLLIQEAAEWSKTKNCASLRVRTNVTRTETHKFYQNTGFILTKEQKIFAMGIQANHF